VDKIREELIAMMNRGLALEHAARIQYLAHAELVKGELAEPIIARLREIADDEEKHEGKFREMIGNYLGGIPTMSMASETLKPDARTIPQILQANLENEKSALDEYKATYQKLIAGKQSLAYEFERLEHELRHIILDEEEHVAEINTLLGT